MKPIESKKSHSNNNASTVLIGIGPVVVGILAGFYYDLFISNERGWSFLLYIFLVSLPYLPTFVVIHEYLLSRTPHFATRSCGRY